MGIHNMKRYANGFTLVEVMVVVTILLIIVAVVFMLYIKVSQFIAYYSAKDDILHSMNMFAEQVENYTSGATKIFTKVDDEYISWEFWEDGKKIKNIYFCSYMLDVEGEPYNAAVRIYVKPIKRNGEILYFLDKTQTPHVCKPLTQIYVDVVKLDDIDECIDSAEGWESFDEWNSARRIIFKPSMVDVKNAFSFMEFKFSRYSLSTSNGENTWPFLKMIATFGILRNVYSDSSCTHRISGYPVEIYPYKQVFNIYGGNSQ